MGWGWLGHVLSLKMGYLVRVLQFTAREEGLKRMLLFWNGWSSFGERHQLDCRMRGLYLSRSSYLA